MKKCSFKTGSRFLRLPAQISALVVFLLILPRPASAGYVILARCRDWTVSPPVEYRARLMIEGALLRLDTSDFTGGRTSLHYSGDEDVIRQARHDSQDYIELNVDTLAKISDGVRNAVESLRRPGPPEAAREPLLARQTGQTDNLSGVVCKQYEITQKKARIQDAWMASWTAAGIDINAFRVVWKFAHCYERLTESLSGTPFLDDLARIPISPLIKINAYPMRVKHYERGRPAYEFSLGKPVSRQIDPASLRMPDNYRKALY